MNPAVLTRLDQLEQEWQQQLPFAFDCRLNQIPEEWHQIAVKFRRANGIRDGDREGSDW
ncbi:hypothetical protein [Synechococcus sp. CB0205]|uniref:hypothetical protein n=1 Tax=Synechococcus sp. CB0205 TaxID=232363 RepID=UPI0002002958|nr:hypothetical protein [Synechococcus sp. CB0205]